MIANSAELKKQLLKYIDNIENRLFDIYYKSYFSVLSFQQVINAIVEGNEAFTLFNTTQLQKELTKLHNATTIAITTAIQTTAKEAATTYDDTQNKALFPTTPEQLKAIESTRLKAAAANLLKKRKLSERVWKLQSDIKTELTIIIQNGIKEGKTPDQIARSAKQYLKEPNKLFRRVRNKETGKMELSKAAKKYNPGRGVYRSSYKNAMRLARTEMNISYNEAMIQRMQADPTCIGYEIRLSNNHTTLINGEEKPLTDICDTLQGRYPKTFIFKGWHPQCRCQIIPLYCSQADWLRYVRAKRKGETWQSKELITELPESFKKWTRSHVALFVDDRVKPYFLTDNLEAIMQSNAVPKEMINALKELNEKQ